MIVRKNSQEIKEEILSSLNKKPLSIEEIRKEVGSNWSTINNYLEELSKEGKVREILSTDKARFYHRTFGDTYFDLPITEEQRKMFHTLFAMIIEEYKKHEKLPTKTHIAKCAVYVIDNEESGLNNLPIVWYLYGMMPLMAIDTTMQYQKEKDLPQEKRIRRLIVDFIKDNGEKKSGQIQKEQHKKYNEEIYVIIDCLFDVLNEPKFENKQVTDLLTRLFIAFPTEDNFLEVFDLAESLCSTIGKMDIIGLKLQDFRKEILLTFDSLWKFIAMYKLCKSLSQGRNHIDKNILLNFYLRGAIEDRRALFKESFNELNSIYLANLADFDVEKIKLSDEAKEVAEIMSDWTGED